MADNKGVINVSKRMARVMRGRVLRARLERGLNRIAGGLGAKKKFKLQGLNRNTPRTSLNN
jgi:hypothetical protein